MTEKCGFKFPDPGNKEEWEEWWDKPRQLAYHALHRKVLAVAVPRAEIKWKCYIVPVPGENHDKEAAALWRTEGVPLPENVARELFGYLEELPYAS